MDRSGRLVIPRDLRSRLNFAPGDVFDVELIDDELRLRPRRVAAAGVTRSGRRAVWNAPGASATTEDIDRALLWGRQERDARASGL